MSRLRIQGGTAGIVAALDAGRLDPLSGEVVDRGRRWPGGRRNWHKLAREERREARTIAKAERRAMGREALAVPDLVEAVPF